MCGIDGCLFELTYKSEDSWFGLRKKMRKLNHSQSTLSLLVPSFLSFKQEDAIIDITVHNKSKVLFTLSEKGTITIYKVNDKGLTRGHSCKNIKQLRDSKFHSIHRGKEVCPTFFFCGLAKTKILTYSSSH